MSRLVRAGALVDKPCGIICLDCDEQLLWWSVPGVWQGGQVPIEALLARGHEGHHLGLAGDEQLGAYHALEGGRFVVERQAE